jgi:muramoyltetrapeptide carboxypeptidase LdcA involved in peptidoglycan recycling
MKYTKPERLKRGDVVAIVSPSWGGPSVFPHVYDNGLKILREWGLEIREYPSARAKANILARDHRFRAKDINDAFADKEIKAVFASIGGDDSVRLLPFLDKDSIAENPKIIMGYSDTTTLLVYGNLQGFITVHGPAIMAGFSQAENLPGSFKAHIREMLFDPKESHEYRPYGQYCDGYLDWSKHANVGKVNELKTDAGWRFLQGNGKVKGELFGGCIEVLEFLKGTDFWPAKDFWNQKTLFFETSEDKPAIDQVKCMLRNYGVQGVFAKISAVLFGRARDYSPQEKEELDKAIKSVIADEFEQPDLPIVTNMDFGHTDPQFLLPLGAKAELDCENKKFKLTESWLS